MSKPLQISATLQINLTWEQWDKLQREAAELVRPIVERQQDMARAGLGFFIHDEFIEACVPPERR